jgi:hypothetical protein
MDLDADMKNWISSHYDTLASKYPWNKDTPVSFFFQILLPRGFGRHSVERRDGEELKF